MSKLQDNKDKLFNKIDSLQTLGENEEKLKEITERVKGPFDRLNENKQNFLDTLLDTQSQLIGSDTNEIFKFFRKILKKSFNDSTRISRILIEELISVINCNSDYVLTGSVEISRNELDVYDILNLDPTDTPGRLVYEKNTTGSPKPFNRQIQSVFIGENTNQFTSVDGSPLFNLTYNESTDNFTVTFPSGGITVADFLGGYYGSIELFDGKNLIAEIIETMFATYSLLFTTSHINTKVYLNRIFSILASICGAGPYTGDDKISEGLSGFGFDEQFDGDFFDFTDEDRRFIEKDIDLKINGLFELSDCNNYVVKINQDIVEDALLDSEYDDFNQEEIFEQLLSDLSNNIVDQQNPDVLLNFGIDFPSVNMSILRRFIKEMPNALMSKVVGMKALLPYLVVNRVVNNDEINNNQNSEQFVVKNERYIQRVGGRVFKIFRDEMVSELKRLLIGLTREILQEIINQKLRSKLFIVQSLLGAIRSLVNLQLPTCATILGDLISLVGLRTGIPTQIPLPLLYGAYTREGANSTRSHINTIEELRKIGYVLDDLPDGSPNLHVASLKKTVEGTFKELAENGAIEFVSNPATVVSPLGGVVPFVRGKGIIITSF